MVVVSVCAVAAVAAAVAAASGAACAKAGEADAKTISALVWSAVAPSKACFVTGDSPVHL